MSFPEFDRFSLRARLAVILSIGLGLTMAVGFMGLHHVVRNQIFDFAWEDLEKRRSALLRYAISHPGEESRADQVLELRSKAHDEYFEISDGHGQLLARSESSHGLALNPGPASGTTLVRYALELPDGHAGIAIRATALLRPDDPRRSLTVTVATETERLLALESRIHTAMAAIAFSSLLAGIVATFFAIQRGLRPVEDLASDAGRIDPDGPRATLEVGRLPRELVALGAKMNGLLRRLFDTRDRERRFTRTVAHELRTPIAEMRMIAEVGAKAESSEALRTALGKVVTTADELQQIVGSLLALARYESGQEMPQPDPVDLAAELRRQVQRAEPAARLRGLTIVSSTPPEQWVVSDAALLRRLLANLVGNAIAHAPAGANVSVLLSREGALRISNPAPHLDPSQLDRLGERFYRAGTSVDDGHAGLGLSLAKAIASVDHLVLGLELTEARELVVTLDGFRPLPSQVDSVPAAVEITA